MKVYYLILLSLFLLMGIFIMLSIILYSLKEQDNSGYYYLLFPVMIFYAAYVSFKKFKEIR